MKTYKELKNELNTLHKLQWSMTRHLGYVVEDHSEAQQRILRNTVKNVPDHEGAPYVPAYAVKWASSLQRTISRIQKQLNKNLKKMREIESQIEALKHPITPEDVAELSKALEVGGVFNPANGEILKVESWDDIEKHLLNLDIELTDD